MRAFIGLFCCFSAILFSGCSESPDLHYQYVADAVGKEEGESRQKGKEILARDIAAFSLDLYKNFSGERGNVLFSPYNISSALSVIYLGARKETAVQMQKVLHFTADPIQLIHLFNEFNTYFSANSDQNLNHPYLSIANSFWFQEGQPIIPEYESIIKKYFGPILEKTNFLHHTEEARQQINDWVAKHTNDRIKELVQIGDINSSTRLFLANALYLQAKWKNQFSENSTKDRPFYLDAEKSIDVPMMETIAVFPILVNDHFSCLRLPYKGGVDSPELSLCLFLPRDRAGLRGFEQGLSVDSLYSTIESMQEMRVKAIIPKFSIKETIYLNEALEELGMKDAFTKVADFSGITGTRDLSISKAMHKTFLSVDEKGTEAAASTGVSLNVKSTYEPEKPLVFEANHPFFFVLIDESTKNILFMGRLLKPI